MCLPLKEIEPYLHHYAGRFQSTRFEHDELVNEAWIGIYDLNIPAFASAGVRWAMLRYMTRQYAQDHRGKKESKIQSIEEEIKTNLFCKDFLAAPKDKRLQIDEDCEYTHSLLRNPNISFADRLLIDQRYFQELQINQIAKIHGCTRQAIHERLNKIIHRLRYLSRVA